MPVPILEGEASSRLLTPEEAAAAESVPLQRLRQWGQLQWQRYRYLLWMLGIAAVGVVAGQLFYLLGERLGPEWLLQSQPEPEPIVVQQWDNVTLQPLQLEGGEQGFVLDFSHTAQADQNATDSNKGPQSGTLQLHLEARPGDLERGVRLGHIGKGGTGLELVLRNAPVPSPAGTAQEGDEQQPGVRKSVALKVQQFVAGQPGRNSAAAYVLATVILLLLTGAILYYLLKRQTRIVTDSAAFREALNLWHPWIMLNRQTPRAIKRYLNRVRYIAMRYRSEDATSVVPLWRRLFRSQALAAEAAIMDEGFIDEAQLVALSAIFSVDASWLRDAEKFDLLAKGKLATLLAQKSRPLHLGMDEDSSAWQAVVEQLQKALQQHLDKHGAAFLEQDARRKFLKVVTATEFA
uniref:hypothetical protein n=1 Tax=Marinobacterium profundum TaxID=1714300 RepID=UPI00082B37A1|nr:hypothetical protein [Marinobacterium profundum]